MAWSETTTLAKTSSPTGGSSPVGFLVSGTVFHNSPSQRRLPQSARYTEKLLPDIFEGAFLALVTP